MSERVASVRVQASSKRTVDAIRAGRAADRKVDNWDEISNTTPCYKGKEGNV